MDTEEYYEQIEQYVLGQLPPEERAAFEQAIENDPELARQVALERALQKTLQEKDVRDFRASLAEAQKKHREEKPFKGGLSPLYLAISIAASLLLLTAVIWWWQSGRADASGEQLANAYLFEFDPGIDPFDPVSRSEDTASLQLLQRFSLEWEKLGSIYTPGKYQIALAQLDTLSSLDPVFSIVSAHELNFYRGMCYLHMGENEKAVGIFQEVKAPFLEKATFFRAIALLRSGRAAEAGSILESIAGTESHPYKEAAVKLLKGRTTQTQ